MIRFFLFLYMRWIPKEILRLAKFDRHAFEFKQISPNQLVKLAWYRDWFLILFDFIQNNMLYALLIVQILNEIHFYKMPTAQTFLTIYILNCSI